MKYAELDMGTIEAVVNKLGGMEGVKRFLSSTFQVMAFELLRLVRTVQVLAQEERTVADWLTQANIGYANDTFKVTFGGMRLTAVSAAELAVHQLTQSSLDASILVTLGDMGRISLAHFLHLIQAQAHGEDGVLLTNGYVNIAYCEDEERVLWTVRASWTSDNGYWSVYADSVEDRDGWSAGAQVLSCK